MSVRVLFTFIITTLGILFWSSQKGPNETRRMIASEKDINPLIQDLDFSKAAFGFEYFKNISNEDVKNNLEYFNLFRSELERNIYSGDRELSFMSNAALISFYKTTENEKLLSKSFKTLFYDSESCISVKSCLFKLNIVLRLADDYNLETFYKLINGTPGVPYFSGLLNRLIEFEEFNYDTVEEVEIFKYIVESAKVHLEFEHSLNKTLSQTRDKNFFSEKTFLHLKEKLNNLSDLEENKQDNSEIENIEVVDFVLNGNYSIDNLVQNAQIWKFRNNVLDVYIDRFSSKDLRAWFSDKTNKELKLLGLKRYFNFELKLPTRTYYEEIVQNSFSGEEEFKKRINIVKKAYNQQVEEFFKGTIKLEKPSDFILELERSLFKSADDDRPFYGFFHQSLIETNLLLNHAKHKKKHHNRVLQNKVIYQGDFNFYYSLQSLDKVWIQNTCKIKKHLITNSTEKSTFKKSRKRKKTRRTNSIYSLVSPYSKRVYQYQGVCNAGEKKLHDFLTRAFALKKAIHASVDEFVIGKGGTLVSVLSWFGAFRVTQYLMRGFLSHSATMSAKYAGKNLPKYSKAYFSNLIKYRLYPFLAVDWFLSSMVMATVRAGVISVIDQTSGKGRGFLKSFTNYWKTYSIMYISIPPVGWLVTKVGGIFTPLTKVLSKSRSFVPKFSSIKVNKKIGSYFQGSIDQIKFNLVEGVKFLPVLYVYDLIDYFFKDKDLDLFNKDKLAARGEGVITWTAVWQFMNHTISRRFGPPKSQVQAANAPKGADKPRRGEGADGGGADGGGAEGQ